MAGASPTPIGATGPAPTADPVRAIVDSVPALACALDQSGCYLFANRAYATWFGHEPVQLVGRHVRDVQGEPAWAVIEPLVAQALAGRSAAAAELHVPYKTGERWMRAYVEPIPGPGGGPARGVTAIVLDVTAERMAREGHERSQAHLLERQRAVVRLGELGLGGAPPPRLFEEALAELTAVLGCSHGGILAAVPEGLRVEAVRGWPQAHVGSTVAATTLTQTGYTLHQRATVVMADAATETRFPPAPELAALGLRSGLSVPIVARDGTPWGVLVLHDARPARFDADGAETARAVAHVLAASLQRLRTEDELRAARDRLARLDERKSEYLAEITHELRTPIAPMQMRVHAMRERPGGPTAADIDAIDRNLARLASLVEKVLDATRADL